MNTTNTPHQNFSADNLWHPNRAVPIIDWFVMSGADFDETTFPDSDHFNVIFREIQYSIGKPTGEWDQYCLEVAALVGHGLPFEVDVMTYLVETAMEQVTNDDGRVHIEVGDEDGTCVWLVRRFTASEIAHGLYFTMLLLTSTTRKLKSTLMSN